MTAKSKTKKGRKGAIPSKRKGKQKLLLSSRSGLLKQESGEAAVGLAKSGAKANANLNNLNNKNKPMTTKDIIEKAKKELVSLTEFKSPNAIGVKKEGNEWVVTVELIEKESIPDGMDILGTYEVRTDQNGGILDYRRTDLRKRVDTTFNPEA